MRRKILLIALIAAVTLAACNNPDTEIDNIISTEDTSHSVTSGETATSLVVQFNAATGKVAAVKTAVLCTAPESGAGYEGFLMKGSEAELKGIDETGTWSLIEYDNKEYYVLSSYLDLSGSVEAETSENMSQFVTYSENTAETSIPTEKESSAVNANSAAVNNDKATNGSTSNSSKPVSNTNNGGTSNSKPANSSTTNSNSTSKGSALTNNNSNQTSQTPTEAPKPVEAPTQAPSCNHNWTTNYVAQIVTEQVWVVDQEAGDYPVYAWRTFCYKCGMDITNEDAVLHSVECKSSYYDDYVQVGTEYRNEVGHYETVEKTQYVANGSLCTICGATK